MIKSFFHKLADSRHYFNRLRQVAARQQPHKNDRLSARPSRSDTPPGVADAPLYFFSCGFFFFFFILA